MPRVNYVKKARKAQGTCSGCGNKIEKGDEYKWIKFRYGGKRKRCGTCRFRPSDLTNSDKLSRVYAAQEAAEDAIADWDGQDHTDLQSALEEAASQIREVAEEYQESCDNIRDSFSESATADECEEKAQELESWADSLEDVDFEDWEAEEEDEDDKKDDKDDEPKDESGRTRDDWIEEQRSLASDAINECPL